MGKKMSLFLSWLYIRIIWGPLNKSDAGTPYSQAIKIDSLGGRSQNLYVLEAPELILMCSQGYQSIFHRSDAQSSCISKSPWGAYKKYKCQDSTLRHSDSVGLGWDSGVSKFKSFPMILVCSQG